MYVCIVNSFIFETKSHCIAQAAFKLISFLTQPSEMLGLPAHAASPRSNVHFIIKINIVTSCSDYNFGYTWSHMQVSY